MMSKTAPKENKIKIAFNIGDNLLHHWHCSLLVFFGSFNSTSSFFRLTRFISIMPAGISTVGPKIKTYAAAMIDFKKIPRITMNN